MAPAETRVTLEGKEFGITNLDKVLFPAAKFTKGELIDYYAQVGPAMLPHIEDRPLTMKRFPDGVEKPYFYEKHAPSHSPDWVRTVAVPTAEGEDGVEYIVIDDLPTLVWAAQLGAIELHVPLWKVGRRRKLPAPPDLIVFDLDPGEGTGLVECCAVAQLVRQMLSDRGLEGLAKTSGSKGLQVYAKLKARATWDKSRGDAHGIATALEKEHPSEVISVMRKALRQGKVFIDWSQNHPAKTTVAVYSVRGRPQPTVSTPVTWDEVDECAASGDPTLLEFTATDVIARVKAMGDLFAPLT
jgi:bifunctional non-homologous end joining protein LigD